MSKLISFFILIPILVTLSGCGDLFGKKVVKDELSNSRLKADCELDVDQFANILKEPITPAINCLEKNLDIFMNVSELGRGGKLSRTSLIKYLKRNRPDMEESTFNIIDAVFSLSNLITGESRDFISRKNVALILDLVRTFNYQAYRNYEHTFGSKDPANLTIHESHRKRVEEGAQEISNALLKIYVADRGDEIHFVDIMKLIKGFIKDGDEETLTKIEGVLFAKKIVTGGDTAILNHKELGFLFEHLPKLLSLVLDGVRYKYLTLSQQETLVFVQDDVSDLANILFHPSRGDRRFEAMFEVDMAITGIDNFIKEDDDKLAKYSALIKEAKRIMTKKRTDALEVFDEMATAEEWVTGQDLETMFNHVFNITARGLAFHRIYNHDKIKPLLDAPQSVYLDPKNYELYFPQDKAHLVDFSRIINTYRYMKGSFDMAYYSRDFKRNANAAAEISMYEYLIKNFFGYYGSSLSMSNEQLKTILKKFENELIDMDIILPRRSRNTAETISLLGSLFQSQSDDNKVLDVDEATEFAISLITAIDAKKKLFGFYDNLNCEKDEFGRIEPNCFKNNFYASICTHYRENFPRLFEFLSAKSDLDCTQNFNSEHNMNYLNASALAARTCHIYPDTQAEIPYTEGDVMSILLAMMHIETTITRWDTRSINNQMDPNEVLDAWAIYKPAIVGMLPDAVDKLPANMKEYLAKVIYQYLVKFEETPKFEGKDLWKTIGNVVKLIAKKAPATRKTIASILKVVSDQSTAKALAEYEANPNDPNVEKPFDCNWMHDPDHIPRD